MEIARFIILCVVQHPEHWIRRPATPCRRNAREISHVEPQDRPHAMLTATSEAD